MVTLTTKQGFSPFGAALALIRTLQDHIRVRHNVNGGRRTERGERSQVDIPILYPRDEREAEEMKAEVEHMDVVSLLPHGN